MKVNSWNDDELRVREREHGGGSGQIHLPGDGSD